MSEAKHTPGPWVYRPLKHDDWGVVRCPDGFNVARAAIYRKTEDELNKHRTNNTDPSEANARLISAAPELLEALEQVVAISDRKHDAWDRARSAIAKAKGETINK